MVRKQDRLHLPDCHRDGLCLWSCECWCHTGANAVPTLPPGVRGDASGKHVQVTLKINGDPVMQHAVGVGVKTPVLIDPGPMSVRTIDRLTIEVRLLP